MLIGKNLTKKYQGQEILRGVDIEIERGKITSLIGPSGAGKTTLLRVLSMLDLPDTGNITLDEKDFKFPQNKEIKVWPKISVVFQQLFLWPHLTLRQNILLPLRNKIDKEYINELIDVLQMKDFIDRYPNEVSIGQRQRAAIARAIALKPDYLLLDEITSSLDVEQIDLVLKFLLKLKERGVGILIITHLLNFAKNTSDQVVFLDSGIVLERGGKEILENPKHERVQKFLSIVKAVS